jgi:hypothetical protein
MNMSSATGRSPVTDGCIAHPFRPEGLVEPLRRAHDAAPRLLDALVLPASATGHVLAQDDDVRIALHGDVERFVDGLNEM